MLAGRYDDLVARNKLGSAASLTADELRRLMPEQRKIVRARAEDAAEEAAQVVTARIESAEPLDDATQVAEIEAVAMIGDERGDQPW